MEHACNIAIIGGGPAGIMTAALLDKRFDITVFEQKSLLATLLPTGGGKCNITNAEPDYKNFSRNYPRGEKFLYSVFSKYSSLDAVEYFEKIGIKTITLDNGRIFPEKLSSSFVREKLLAQIKHCHIEKAKVINILQLNKGFKIKTTKSEHYFDKVIVTAGGHCDFNILNNLKINIIPYKPALTGLCTDTSYSVLSGVVLKNILNKDTCINDDLLFTHFGISGPLAFKISSIKARDEFPYTLSFDLLQEIKDSNSFQNILNTTPKKEIKTVLSEYLPKNFVIFILKNMNIDGSLLCCNINGKTRDLILNGLKNYQIKVIKPRPDGETVMSGGIDLKYINPKTFEYKGIPNLFFAGEILDIDGFCGGFNLQNCWSGAFIVSEAINTQN